MQYDRAAAQNRIREFRKSRGWSLSDMGAALSEAVSGMKLSGENGKQTVSQLERGKRGITTDIAFAYADIFNVSLECVYGCSNSHKPQLSHYTDKELLTELLWRKERGGRE